MQRWSLTVYAPNQAPRTHEYAENTLVVGSQDAQGVLALAVPGVAARHALLHVQGGLLRVEALDPSAAVFVQGTAISEPVEIGCPASIRIGEAELKITVCAEMAEAARASDSTLRVVHPAVLSARPMAYPSSPEMTGRIYAAELEKSDGGIAVPFKTPSEEAAGMEEAEAPTLTFSFEGEEVPIADKLSMAVDYATQTEIARGGMGKIFSAEDATLGRVVALKVSTVKDPKQDAQFFREARVLARLAHPNIVPIHSFGRDTLGRPFYSMKLVKGRTLQAIIKQLQLGAADTAVVFTRQRLLEVFRKVCDAVSFAHAQGVLHRDLKPENIMVGEYGEVLVMDWGLAKDLPNTAGAGTRDTREDAEPETLHYVEGTPQYMSPEQAAGLYGGLDQRSDLYSLGGILFAILTLRPAVKGGSVHDVLRKVCNGELETMTLPVENVAEQKHGAMTRVVPEALRAVTLKALAKNREDRYPSVEALVADIEAYQGGFATVAEQATVFRQMTLFVKRHRAASALAAVLLVAAGVFTVRLAASERRAQNNALRAERESQSALANARLAQASARRAEEQARIAEENAARAVAEKEEARKATAAASMANAEAAEDTRNAESIRNALEAVPSDLRTQQWEYLHNFVDSSKQTIAAKNNSTWKECVPHPQRPGVLVALQQDNWLRLLNLNDGSSEDVAKLEGAFSFGVLAVSEDAEKLAVISSLQTSPGVYASSVEILRLRDGRRLLKIPISQAREAALKFSPNGRLLLKTHRRSWTTGAEPTLFDVETGVACWPASYVGIYAADFVPSPSAASKTLVCWASKSIGLLEIDPLSDQTLKPAVKFPLPQSSEPFLSANGLFVTTEDGAMRRINPADGNAMYEFRLPGKLRSVRDAVCLPEHNLLLCLIPIAERSAVLDLRDAQSGAAIASFPMVLDGIGGAREWMLTAHPASGHVAVFRGNTMKVWKVARTTGVITDKIESLSAPGFTFFGDTNKVLQVSIENKPIAGQRAHQLEIRQPADNRLSLERELGAEKVDANFPVVLSPSRDGKTVGVLIQSGTGFSLKTLQFEGGSPRMTATRKDFSPRYGFFLMSPDGAQLWGGTGIFDAATGEKRQELVRTRVEKGADSYSSSQVCWTDNAHVVELCTVLGDSEELERALVVWSTSEAKFVHWTPAPHARAVAASPDGAALAEAGSDQRVRIRDAATLEVNRVLRVHDAPVADVAWNPRRPYLATAGEDYRVRIWDLDSGRMLEEIGFLEALPAQLHWSPDGRTLAVRGQPFKDTSGRNQARRYFFFPKCCNPE